MGISMRSFFRIAQKLAALLAPAVCLTALQPNHRLTQYGHRSWTSQDSHLPGIVDAVTQTVDGKLWVGTEFGLFGFDGVEFSP